MSAAASSPPISLIESEEVFEERIAWPGVAASISREDGLLDLHLLRNRLDNEVDVAKLLIAGRAGDQCPSPREAGVGLLLGQLFLLHLTGELALGDGAGFLQRCVDEVSDRCP